jgi:NAD dependent epimerase/dehydratase family
MARLRVLFIGGSGVISSACSRVAADSGIELFVLNRGRNSARPLPPGVTMLRADMREPESVRDAINDLEFDAVTDCVAFTSEHVRTDIELFRGRTGQYNAKVRSIVPGWRAVIPFELGAREIVEWYLADPARQVTDASLDAVMDKLAAAWTL